MAKVDIKMPDDFLEKLSKLGAKTDEISERVLEAGGEVVLAKIRSNLSSVVGKDTKVESRSTGELERSLGMTKAKVDRQGNHNIKIGFAEPRSDGGSNAKIANILACNGSDTIIGCCGFLGCHGTVCQTEIFDDAAADIAVNNFAGWGNAF